jgi:hypothetical protein
VNSTKRNQILICAIAIGCVIFLFRIAKAGTILRASCPCGYHQDNIMAGGGMASFTTYCGVPAYCSVCKTMEILNWLEESPRCRTCQAKPVFYNDPSLQEKPSAGAKPRDVFSWNTDKKGTFKLSDINYLCPQCRKLQLRFTVTGMWV